MKEIFAVQTCEVCLPVSDWSGKYEVAELYDVTEDDIGDDFDELYCGDDEVEAEQIFDDIELDDVGNLDVMDDVYCGEYVWLDGAVIWKITIGEDGTEKKELKSVKYQRV